MTNERHDQRPSPEALLRAATDTRRGRLKVFLGAAPGVGKTYEMLSQARQRKLEGADVVAGVVETHGRVETDLLSKSIEKIPKKRVLYKGRVLAEMDLDAILQRRPALVLVDELAHSNAEGSRHPKRYMDVEELLSAGIDVYTTLNIQHLESLNDVVAGITRVRVNETVPDSVIDQASDVELVDLTPEDLLQRLKDGKVYLGETAERARQHYFMPGNLAALRELALRRTAQRVDEQMVDYMRAHAIEGPWQAGERILVCIDARPGAPALVRYARRLAGKLRAPWSAIHIETAHARLSETQRDYIADALRLTERLGGQAVTLPSSSAADGVLDYARDNNVTLIVAGTAPRIWWRRLINRSITQKIIRRAGAIGVYVVPEQLTHALQGSARKPATTQIAGRKFDALAYAGSLGMVLAALVVGVTLRSVGVSNVALGFITAVLVSGISYGLWPSLFACLAAILAYNFFFMPPLYTFTIADPDNVAALFFFTVVALIAGYLSARMRAQTIATRERAVMTERLYLFSQKLAGVFELDDLLWATAYQIAQMLKLRVVILLAENGSVAVRAGYPPEDTLDDADKAAAKWVCDHATPAGRGADTLPGAKRLFLPIRTARGVVGIIGLDSDRPGPLLTPGQRRLFNALADQAAIAIERIALAQEIDRAKVASEAERLRAALLTSISHDLRTPLAGILGSATTLRSEKANLDRQAEDDLVATIQEEAERLNRFIANLLDMTRLESGAVEPRFDLIDIGDVVGSALRRAQGSPAKHDLEIDIAADLPPLRVDPVLFEQVLFNLIDNAAKYAPSGTPVRITARAQANMVRLQIADSGPGIPQADLENIFDKFYRVRAGDGQRAGTGLGLSICRGFIEAMGGTIAASNRTDGSGAIFTVTLPLPAEDAREQAA